MFIDRVTNCKAVQKIFWFQGTVFYIIFLAVVVFFCHVFGWDLFGFYFLGVNVVFTALFNPDTKPIIPVVMFIVFNVSRQNAPGSVDTTNYYFQTAILVQLIIIAVFMLGSLVARLVIRKEAKKLFSPTILIGGFAAVGAGLLANGLFTIDYTIMNLALGLSMAIPMVVGYVFFFHTVKWDKDTMRYLAYVMTIAALLVTAELIVLFASKGLLTSSVNKGEIVLGWGVSNSIGTVLLLFMPFSLYLMHTSKHGIVYYIASALILLAIVLTLSRATLLVALPLFVAAVIYSALEAKSRIHILIAGLITLVVGIAVVIFKADFVLEKLKFYIETGLDDRGRFELWEMTLDILARGPIFGAGYMYLFNDYFRGLFWMHNTILQFLALGGVVGLLTYLYHRMQTVKVVFHKITVERLYMGAAIAALLINSLLDVGMSMQHVLLYYGIILAFIEMDYVATLAGSTKTGLQVFSPQKLRKNKKTAAEADAPLSAPLEDTEPKGGDDI